MKVIELIDRLKECNPNAIVTVWFNDEITSVNEIGGDSFKTNAVKIWHEGHK